MSIEDLSSLRMLSPCKDECIEEGGERCEHLCYKLEDKVYQDGKEIAEET